MATRTTTDREGRRFLEDTGTGHGVALEDRTMQGQRVVFERFFRPKDRGGPRFKAFALAARRALPRLFFGCPERAVSILTTEGPRCLIPVRQRGRLEVRAGLIPVGIFHPAARRAELLRDLRSGALQRRRAATRSRAMQVLRLAERARTLTPAQQRRLVEIAS